MVRPQHRRGQASSITGDPENRTWCVRDGRALHAVAERHPGSGGTESRCLAATAGVAASGHSWAGQRDQALSSSGHPGPQGYVVTSPGSAKSNIWQSTCRWNPPQKKRQFRCPGVNSQT